MALGTLPGRRRVYVLCHVAERDGEHPDIKRRIPQAGLNNGVQIPRLQQHHPCLGSHTARCNCECWWSERQLWNGPLYASKAREKRM
jgi:hypothetical protein